MASLGTVYINIAPDMTGVQSKISQGLKGVGDSAAKEISAKSAMIAGAVAGLASTAISKAGRMITSSVGDAVKRVDTLDNSSRVFANMGFATDSTKKAMDNLVKSIKGLPTSLDEAVSGVQILSGSIGDVEKSQKVFSAMNNAILGFGGSADQVNNAVRQLAQLPMDGPLDAQTWNSLMNSGFTPVLTAMAKKSNMTMGELKKDFSSQGTKSVQDFMDMLLELDEKGGGGLVSLRKIAEDSTSGIGTGFANMKVAIVRGVAEIIKSIGSKNISSAVSNIGNAFEIGLKGVSKMVNFIKSNDRVFEKLAQVIVTAMAAFIAFNLAVKATQAVMATYATVAAAVNAVSSALTLVMSLQAQGLGVVRAAWMALNIVMNANPIGLVVGAVAALVAVLGTVAILSDRAKSATDRLNDARQTAKEKADALKTSEDNLRGALLQVEGAELAVERSQLAYNEAVAQYGPKSLEAREAAYNLKNAQNDLATANKNASDRTKENEQAQRDFAKAEKEVRKAQDSIKEGADGISSGYLGIMNAANKAKDAMIQANKKGDTAASRKAFVDWQSAGLKIPGRASGGSVQANKAYFVGENRDGSLNKTSELFIPRTAGYVANARNLQGLLQNTAPSTSVGALISQTNNVYTELDMIVVNRNLMWEFNRT